MNPVAKEILNEDERNRRCVEEPIGSFPIQPYHEFNSSFMMSEGMVIELEPHVVTADGKKGLTIGSPVLVTETSCRLLSQSWKPEFRTVQC